MDLTRRQFLIGAASVPAIGALMPLPHALKLPEILAEEELADSLRRSLVFDVNMVLTGEPMFVHETVPLPFRYLQYTLESEVELRDTTSIGDLYRTYAPRRVTHTLRFTVADHNEELYHTLSRGDIIDLTFPAQVPDNPSIRAQGYVTNMQIGMNA